MTGRETTGGERERPKSESMAEKNRRLKRLRERLEQKDRELAALRAEMLRSSAGEETGVRPENIVWVFGAGRTGSTWLSSMMAELSGHTLWHEPLVGELFGHLYYVRGAGNHRSPHFVLGRHREVWTSSIRRFVLDNANGRFPEAANGGFLVVKEPNGSIGAPLLMEALPESRIVLLVRDPRDVAASILDARREGSWLYEKNRARSQEWRNESSSQDPDALAQTWARGFLQRMGNAKQAYDAHEGPRTLVRYEDLRVDALGELRRLYSELDIAVNDDDLQQAVRAHTWENIPEGKKGVGKFYRKASPGSWREDLSPEQTRVVEEITRPILEAFYPL